jgi:hypothetical protein
MMVQDGHKMRADSFIQQKMPWRKSLLLEEPLMKIARYALIK